MKDDSITFISFLKTILRNIKLISVFVMFFAISSVAYSLFLTNQYTSILTVAPSTEENTAEAPGGIGGIANLVGINLSSGNRSEFIIELASSKSFAIDFIEKNNLVPKIIASNGWNSSSGSLKYNAKIYDVQSNAWIRKKPRGASTNVPSAQEAYKVWKRKIFSSNVDKRTNFLDLSFTHYSPNFAKELADLFLSDLNQKIRDKDIQEATRAIDYLNVEVDSVELSEVRAALFQLIQKQHQKRMLANAKEEYAAEVINRPLVEEYKSKPSRAIICIVGTFLGFVISLMYIFLRNYFRDNFFTDSLE